MYLCICNSVSEDRVVEAIKSGCTSFNEISKATVFALSAGSALSRQGKSARGFFASTVNILKTLASLQPLDL